ncbi:collagenase-like PrtC family protease [Paenibacillus sp. PastF-4]|nr:collagenase-like PrtC family protease [Paenibacillus sp. PastF-4]
MGLANIVSKVIDRYLEGQWATPSKEVMRELQQSFSRGFTHSFL